jgi:hypothetical protein
MMTTGAEFGLGKTGSRPLRSKVDVRFFAPPEQASSRTWKVRGPKAEHFLASYSCAYSAIWPASFRRLVTWRFIAD